MLAIAGPVAAAQQDIGDFAQTGIGLASIEGVQSKQSAR